MNYDGQRRRATRLGSLILCALAMAGCATQKPKDVGAVVVAPRVQLPPVPAVVMETEPMPAGYFQRTLLDYFSGSSEKQTK